MGKVPKKEKERKGKERKGKQSKTKQRNKWEWNQLHSNPNKSNHEIDRTEKKFYFHYRIQRNFREKKRLCSKNVFVHFRGPFPPTNLSQAGGLLPMLGRGMRLGNRKKQDMFFYGLSHTTMRIHNTNYMNVMRLHCSFFTSYKQISSNITFILTLTLTCILNTFTAIMKTTIVICKHHTYS
jgi:hypothetical protein